MIKLVEIKVESLCLELDVLRKNEVLVLLSNRMSKLVKKVCKLEK